MTRRELLLSIPALALAQSGPRLPARKLSQMTLNVGDVKRSVDFYQGLFGMPVQARQGSTVFLRVGTGPQYLALQPAGNAKPGFNHFGLAVDKFQAEAAMKVLADAGVTGEIKTRGGTAELFFQDPGGVRVQLQDTTYCGGSGALGNVCGSVEAAPKKGSIALTDLSHFTIFTADAARAQKFYQETFGLAVQAHQGAAAPVFGVGGGPQFLMLAAGPGAAAGAGGINHGCFLMRDFEPDAVLKTLTDFGLKPRGSGAAAPLTHYVTLRMENRGGAPGGTPELYFTDPDGILLQLQDPRYCGGGGKLGEICQG